LTPPSNEALRPDDEWKNHEHIAPPVQVEAEKLVESAGSPELAKQAIDASARQQEGSDAKQEEFARRCGYASADEMLSISQRLTASDRTKWWASPVRDEGWMLWREGDFSALQRFPSLEACHRYLLANAGDRS
jgi:hypothetical protein